MASYPPSAPAGLGENLAVISSVSHWYGQQNFIGTPNVLAWLWPKADVVQGTRDCSFREFLDQGK